MKKSFKRAGVAVLSMAMLLSMGAVSASALDTTTQQKYKTPAVSDTTVKYSVYKVANVAVNGNAYDYTVNSDDLEDGAGFETILTAENGNLKYGSAVLAENTASATKQALATALAGVTDNETAVQSNIAPDTEFTLTPGYYLVKSSDTDAAPILLSVRSDDNYTTTARQLIDKSTGLTVKKYITAVGTGNGYAGTINTADDDYVAETNVVSHEGIGGIGAEVDYKIVTKTPKYDSSVTALSHSFKIEDKAETGIAINNTTGFSITVNGVALDAANYDIEWNDYKDADNKYTGFLITFDDDYILTAANQDKEVVVTFKATIDTDATTGINSNDNDVYILYDNDFQTNGAPDKTNKDTEKPSDPVDPENPPEHSGKDNDHTAIFTAELDVNKVFDGNIDNTKNATFALSTYNTVTSTKGATPITTITTNKDGVASTLEFKGLAAGTYVLEETVVPNGFKKAADIIFEISDDDVDPYTGSFEYTSSNATFGVDNGVASTDINNISGQTLPGTGGIGTTLFTVGGAAIILVAGFMFVLYMKKRNAEEK